MITKQWISLGSMSIFGTEFEDSGCSIDVVKQITDFIFCLSLQTRISVIGKL